MLTRPFSSIVRDALLRFAWDRWTQLGMAGVVGRTDKRAADPEALLLFSLEAARTDPRLFDEILDWLVTNGRLLSLPRIKNLAARTIDVGPLWASLAWADAQDPSLRWPSAERASDQVVDLFPDLAASIAVADPDPTFLAHGYRRPPIEQSGKSAPPDLMRPSAFAFRLRALFGLGSRAEVVRHLLTTTDLGWSTTSQVTDAAAFSKRIVHDSLQSLSDSGTILSRWQGNERLYTAEAERWAHLLRVPTRDLPRFGEWPRLLRAATEILRWVREDERSERSPYIRSSEARELMHRIGSDLQAAGIQVPDDRRYLGEAYWPVFVETVEETLAAL